MLEAVAASLYMAYLPAEVPLAAVHDLALIAGGSAAGFAFPDVDERDVKTMLQNTDQP